MLLKRYRFRTRFTRRLQLHIDRVVRKIDGFGDDGFTPRQRRALENHPYLRPAFSRNRIDVRARRFIKNDRRLNRANLRSNYNNGPDFVNPINGNWWDITTPKAWPAHVRKYGPGGTLLST